MKHIPTLVLVAAFGMTTASLALAADEHKHHAPAPAASAKTQAPMSEGEVKKVDKAAGKITIKHGPLVNLDMPPMTMAFRVKDPAMLEQVKSGDKIRFVADKGKGGAYMVTKLEAAQ